MTMTADLGVAAANARCEAAGGDETLIPTGDYCYTVLGFAPAENGQPPRMLTRPCPYLAASSEAPAQAWGYCAKLQTGDWEEDGTMLLWEGVKECGINQPDEDEPDGDPGEEACGAPDDPAK